MKLTFVALAFVALTAVAAPASAVTYDAFSSFNGTQGAGNFYYGTYDGQTASLFTASSNCFIDNSVCLQSQANHDVPGVTKSIVTSFQYGSVNVPNDRLLLHPGAGDDSVFAAFVASVSGVYAIDAAFDVQDVEASGVGVSLGFLSSLSGTGVFPLTTLTLDDPDASLFGYFYLAAGDAIGFVFDKDGFYGNDSTGLNFTLTSVPEPAAWALLIAGFGLVGIALRRRHGLALAA